MNVQFLKGLSSVFKAEGFSPVATTFYYLTDTQELYLGSKLLSNEVSLAEFESLKGRVKTLEDWKLTLTELSKDNGTNDLVKVTVATENGAVKSVTVDDAALDQKLADDLQAAKDYTDAEVLKITTGAGYATTKYVDDAIDADVRVVTDYIAEHEAEWLAKTDISGLEQRMTAVEGVADAAQTAQEVSDAIDAKIRVLDLANTYEPKGAEKNAKDYTDEKIDDLIKTYLDGETDEVINTLEEVAAWINNDTTGATKIIEDISKNSTNIENLGKDVDAIELQLNGIPAGNGTVKAAIDSVDAKFASYTKTEDLGDLATKDESELNLEQYAKSADLGDLAGKNEAELNLEQYAKSADIGSAAAKDVEFFATAAQGEAGVAAKAVTDTLKSAAFVDTTAFDAAGTAAELIGKAASVEGGPTGVYAAIQGATENTVKDCVDSINSIMGVLTWGEIK